MNCNRREFLSMCAAASAIARGTVAAEEAQARAPQTWPSPFQH
jgi:hypothetical protein